MSLIDILELDKQQRHAALLLNCDVALSAGAGSGKTRTLVARYLYLLEQGLAPGEIAAITFTEKAAREMRNRIRAEVQKVRRSAAPDEREHWSEIEADIDAAPIGTFHGLCARILRAHPAEAGIDPQFSVLDEGKAAVWQARAVADALNWAVDQEALIGLFQGYTPGGLAEVLGVLFDHRLDVNPADAATTRQRWNAALLKRMSAFAQAPEVQASIDDLHRLTGRALAADAGEKLAVQVEGLRAVWGLFVKQLAAGEMVGAAQALFRLRREYMSLGAGKRTSSAKAALRELQAEYDGLVDPWLGGKGAQDPAPDEEIEQTAAQAVAALLTLFNDALRRYEDQKRAAAALDFDDLEGMASHLLSAPVIRERWQTQLKALLVDEFQDTNERQRQIVNALAGFADGKTGRLFVVGDAKQSIYRFRGADVSVFKGLTSEIVARGGQSLVLDHTYRAHAVLVAAMNELLAVLMGGQDIGRPFAVGFAPLTAVRLAPKGAMCAPFVEFLCGLGETADEARPAGAQLLAKRLRELHEQQQVRWDDVALLFRASSGFAAYEDALEQAGIPFVTVAGRGFYDRPEIRDLLNILRALANPWDDLAMAGLLRSPAFALSDDALYRLRWAEDLPDPPPTRGTPKASRAPQGRAEPRAFRAALRSDLAGLTVDDRRQAERARDLIARLCAQVDRIPVAELLKLVLDETLYPAVLSTVGRLQRNCEKLLADAHASGFIRVNEFLEYVETLNAVGAREGESPAQAEGAVRLMTVHRAKGLQFPVVVMADASRAAPNSARPLLFSDELGLAPNPGRLAQPPLAHAAAKADDKLMAAAEDLRLIYVAATRAEEMLIICGHELRRSSEVWLTMLLAAAGSNLADLAQAQGQNSALAASGALVGMWAAQAAEPSPMPAAPAPAPQAPPPLAQTLYAPLPTTLGHRADKAEAEVDDIDNTETFSPHEHAQHGALDGALVGALAHQAIRRWTFPGEPNYRLLLETAALNGGLADPDERGRSLARVAELLGRLRADVRWAELDRAERHHEVPYVTAPGRTAAARMLDGTNHEPGGAGFLDLLYRKPGGVWQLVDFKTDALADLDTAERLTRGAYGTQLRRYLQAARQLLGAPVAAELCFLDVTNAICWKTVDATVH